MEKKKKKMKLDNYNIAILIPCFNEEKTIGKVIEDFQKEIPKANIYVFDNNSTDKTVHIAEEKGVFVLNEQKTR